MTEGRTTESAQGAAAPGPGVPVPADAAQGARAGEQQDAAGQADVPGLLRWLRAHEHLGTVTLACHDAVVGAPARGDAVVVWPGCLDEDAVAVAPQLLAEGAARVGLARCGRHKGESPAERAWTTLLPGLLESAEPTGRSLRHGETIRAGAPPLPRRALVGAVGAGPLDLAADAQTRTLQALRHLVRTGRAPQPDTSPTGPLASLPATGTRLAASGCTLCAACTWACPTGALTTLQGDGASAGLVHSVAACRGCRDCLSSCPVDALQVTGPVALAEAWLDEPELLAATAAHRCERCGSTCTDDGKTLCPLCQARERSPFMTELPVEAAAQLPPEVLATIRRSRGLA